MSFIRKSPLSTISSLPGTKLYINQVLITSTGIENLDAILNGGIQTGSILLLKEDEYTNYYKIFTNYIVSESISQNHPLLTFSKENEAKYHTEMVNHLPGNLSYNEAFPFSIPSKEEKEDSKIDSEHLKIAWQYGKYIEKKNVLIDRNGLCSKYDNNEKIQPGLYYKNQPKHYTFASSNTKQVIDFLNDNNCMNTINRVNNNYSVVGGKTVTRVIFHSLMNIDSNFLEMCSKIKSSQCVCIITIPRCIKKEYEMRLNHMADLILSLKSFLGNGLINSTDAGYGDFDGIITIEKRPNKHVLQTIAKENEYLFKIKRKKIAFEIVSLPPEESRTETKPSTSDF